MVPEPGMTHCSTEGRPSVTTPMASTGRGSRSSTWSGRGWRSPSSSVSGSSPPPSPSWVSRGTTTYVNWSLNICKWTFSRFLLKPKHSALIEKKSTKINILIHICWWSGEKVRNHWNVTDVRTFTHTQSTNINWNSNFSRFFSNSACLVLLAFHLTPGLKSVLPESSVMILIGLVIGIFFFIANIKVHDYILYQQSANDAMPRNTPTEQRRRASEAEAFNPNS